AYGLGGYRTLTRNGATYDVTPTGGASYPGDICKTIQSGQAFFAKSFSLTGTVKFTEGCKVTGSSNINKITAPATQLRTNLYVIIGDERILLDGNLVQYVSGYSKNVDKMDALKLMNANENFGLSRNGSTLIVERSATWQHADTIFYKT